MLLVECRFLYCSYGVGSTWEGLNRFGVGSTGAVFVLYTYWQIRRRCSEWCIESRLRFYLPCDELRPLHYSYFIEKGKKLTFVNDFKLAVSGFNKFHCFYLLCAHAGFTDYFGVLLSNYKIVKIS